jgi:hypothetical protein
MNSVRRLLALSAFVALLFVPAVLSHAQPRPDGPRREMDVAAQPEPSDRWFDRLPKAVRRFVVTVQDMLVVPKP